MQSDEDNKRAIIKGTIERENSGLTPKEVDKATTIGLEAWKGNVGAGQAASTGIESVKKLRE